MNNSVLGTHTNRSTLSLWQCMEYDVSYQLIDPFTIFYYEFMSGNSRKDPQFWSHSLNKPVYNTWCGLSFERVCMIAQGGGFQEGVAHIKDHS